MTLMDAFGFYYWSGYKTKTKSKTLGKTSVGNQVNQLAIEWIIY
tara:strand:- start:127 stop:258 length:132 start_codon:yes stop_codon:yes gene_type:complete